jgi:hypothetical protein
LLIHAVETLCLPMSELSALYLLCPLQTQGVSCCWLLACRATYLPTSKEQRKRQSRKLIHGIEAYPSILGSFSSLALALSLFAPRESFYVSLLLMTALGSFMAVVCFLDNAEQVARATRTCCNEYNGCRQQDGR